MSSTTLLKNSICMDQRVEINLIQLNFSGIPMDPGMAAMRPPTDPVYHYYGSQNLLDSRTPMAAPPAASHVHQGQLISRSQGQSSKFLFHSLASCNQIINTPKPQIII